MKKINVLIFPCGAENALEIYQALKYSVHVNVIGASSIDDMGSLVYDNYISGVPYISDSGFESYFSNLIEENKIDVVFATHDTVQQYLSEKKFNTYLINGDCETGAITRSKKLTYNLFRDYSWCPFVFNLEPDIYPVVCKPDQGQGGQNVYKISSSDELNSKLKDVIDPVVVEYLPGAELTIDCFTDRNRNLIWIQPRTREKVKAGISMKSKFFDLDDELENIAKDINGKVIMRGPWFFQVKQDLHGKWKLLEISSRIAGTMVAQRAKGVNLPLMAIQDYLERDLTTIPINQVELVERAIYTKPKFNFAFNTVYIDFDDTIILNNKIVVNSLAFLYKMRNLNKKIVLITRHENILTETFSLYAISDKLFDGVIHITNGEPKSKFITEKNAIFIDNHFIERKEVFEKCGIPVFDVDYMNFLI